MGEYTALEILAMKAKDYSKLVKKVITTGKGFRKTVWVLPNEDISKGSHPSERHAQAVNIFNSKKKYMSKNNARDYVERHFGRELADYAHLLATSGNNSKKLNKIGESDKKVVKVNYFEKFSNIFKKEDDIEKAVEKASDYLYDNAGKMDIEDFKAILCTNGGLSAMYAIGKQLQDDHDFMKYEDKDDSEAVFDFFRSFSALTIGYESPYQSEFNTGEEGSKLYEMTRNPEYSKLADYSKLSMDEFVMIRAYTDLAYIYLKRDLNTNDNIKAIRDKCVTILNSAIDNIVNKTKIVETYRVNTDISGKEFHKYKEYKGEIINSDGFLSSSYDNNNFYGSCAITMKCKSGKIIQDISYAGENESEVIYKTDVRFLVKSVNEYESWRSIYGFKNRFFKHVVIEEQ